MEKYLWKALRAGLKSQYNDYQWEIGKWHKTECKKLCHGFNASERIIDAMGYVNMEILAKVEVRGKHFIGNNKQTWEEMKIVKAWKWEKKDSVALSIYAAELCIKNYEKEYPNDKRPRKAIEAAKKWLKEPTEENRSAASVACAAVSAAVSAVVSAAESAARSAAYAAESAAHAAEEKTLNQIEKWILKRAKTLKEVK